jgi:hypothetical protein
MFCKHGILDVGNLDGVYATGLATSLHETRGDLDASPDHWTVTPVSPYCVSLANVIFGACEDGRASVCRSRGRFAGDIQLTFHRSFSYPHSKSLFRHYRPLGVPLAARQEHPYISLPNGDPRQFWVFHTGSRGPLGHNLVFAIRGKSRLRLDLSLNLWSQRFRAMKTQITRSRRYGSWS